MAENRIPQQNRNLKRKGTLPGNGGRALRVAIYARHSKEESTSVSINTQLKMLRAWAEFEECSIVGEYIDDGYTGTKDTRPDFQRMIADANRGAFDILAVGKLDRFFRSTRLFHQYIHDLEQLGVAFVSIQEGIDTSDVSTTGTGRLFLNILAAFAEFESARIGERVRDSRRTRIAAGRWPAGRCRYAYEWSKEDRRFEIVEDQAEVVRLIYELYLYNDLGQCAIAQRLNDEGYRTRPTRGNGQTEPVARLWNPRAVWEILANPCYIGEHTDFAYPSIVSPALFEAAQRKRKEARKVLRNPGRWLLQGICTCGVCGRSVSPRLARKQNDRRYLCRGTVAAAHLDSSARCTLPSLRAEPFENAVWQTFANTITNSKILQESVERALEELEQHRKRLGDTSIDEELGKLRARKERLLTAYVEGGMARDRFLDNVSELNGKAKELQARRNGLDPGARLQIAKLEDFTNYVRKCLRDGHISVEEDGVYAFDSRVWGQGSGHRLGDTGLDVPSTVTALSITDEEPDDSLSYVPDFGGLTHDDFARARVESMRRLLMKFDIRVVAFPEHIEIRGLIPTQTVQRNRDQVLRSAGKG